MHRIVRTILLLSLTTLLAACDAVEYSPNQKFNRNTPTNVNQRELTELSQKKPGRKIKIAVTGDTQRNYKNTIDFVNHLNKYDDIDFVFLNGDISDFGLLLEFDAIYDIYNSLNVPFITVIGNHDLVANGMSVYKRMFGPLNFSFQYGDIKFICHDTNGREYNFDGSTPNLTWLKEELKPSSNSKYTIAISHVPSDDGDFDPNLARPYEQLLNGGSHILASLHSHQHQAQHTYYPQRNGTPFIVINGIVNRSFTLLEIEDGKINAKEIKY